MTEMERNLEEQIEQFQNMADDALRERDKAKARLAELRAKEPFRREERFIVIKRKHLTERQEDEVRRSLAAEEIETVECVVVESDWPEYELVWQMIEARCTGAALPLAPVVGMSEEEIEGLAERLFIESGCTTMTTVPLLVAHAIRETLRRAPKAWQTGGSQ